MESNIADSVEIVLIHMLYARAELLASPSDGSAEIRAREHIDEAFGLLKTLVPQRAQRKEAREADLLVESVEIALIQTLYAEELSTSGELAQLRTLRRIDEAIKLMQLLAPRRT